MFYNLTNFIISIKIVFKEINKKQKQRKKNYNT